MFIFGLCFILYFIKLSGTSGFWSNLRITDVNTHRAAKAYQNKLRKVKKAEHDVKFLHKCKEHGVYPKFVRWKNIKSKSQRDKNRYYSRILNEALDKRHKELKSLRKEHESLKENLLKSTTWMKCKLILFSIDRLQSNTCIKTKERHEKKLDALMVNKRIFEGIKEKPNRVITNLANIELNNEEIEILRLGLKHGLLVRPQESEMIVIMEDIYGIRLLGTTL